MNPVTFNEPFRNLLQIHKKESSHAESCFSAPLFEHNNGSEDWSEDDFPELFDRYGFPRMPYESLRLSVIEEIDVTHSYKADAMPQGMFTKADMEGFLAKPIAERVTSTKRHAMVRLINTKAGPHLYALMFMVWQKIGVNNPRFEDDNVIAEAHWAPEIEPKNRRVVYSFFNRKTGNPITVPSDKDSQKAAWAYLASFRNSFGKFCTDYFRPNTFVARVSPTTSGKSVQWTEQRTHYVLIDHAHPANKAEVKSMTIISDKPEAALKRMAHSRRSHKRKLRSARFRHKQGQTIIIPSAWIGPKEWMGDSGQIYKIVTKNSSAHEK